jgi:hypothetical protein
MDEITAKSEAAEDLDLEILELTEATAMEEMGASSTVGSSSTCKPD